MYKVSRYFCHLFLAHLTLYDSIMDDEIDSYLKIYKNYVKGGPNAPCQRTFFNWVEIGSKFVVLATGGAYPSTSSKRLDTHFSQ